MHTRPEIIECIIDHIVKVELMACQRFFEATKGYLDIAYFGNDFGTHRGLFISPELFNKFIDNVVKNNPTLKNNIDRILKNIESKNNEIINNTVEKNMNLINIK